jgi:hypothetical protein
MDEQENLAVVQAIMRHAKMDMTLYYSHSRRKAKRMRQKPPDLRAAILDSVTLPQFQPLPLSLARVILAPGLVFRDQSGTGLGRCSIPTWMGCHWSRETGTCSSLFLHCAMD